MFRSIRLLSVALFVVAVVVAASTAWASCPDGTTECDDVRPRLPRTPIAGDTEADRQPDVNTVPNVPQTTKTPIGAVNPSATVEVTAPKEVEGEELPFTGGQTTALVAIAMAALSVGGAVFVLTRRVPKH